MYREPHLQKKSNECCDIWHEWFKAKYEDKDEQRASEIRKKWGKCVTELVRWLVRKSAQIPGITVYRSNIY